MSSRREKVLGMPKCGEGQTISRLVGSLEEVFTANKNGW